MNWYAKKTGSGGQGLVIEEGTGRNVAVAYDEKDAPLLAAAPDLLAALREIGRIIDSCAHRPGGRDLCEDCSDQAGLVARAAIAKVTEGE